MTGKKLLFVVVVLLVVSLALGGIAGCCPPAEEPTPTPTPTPTPLPGVGAPTLEVGDSWTYSLSYPGTAEVAPQEVIVTATLAKADADGYEVAYQFESTQRQSGDNVVRLEPPMTRWYNPELDFTRMETSIGTDIPSYEKLMLAMTVEVTHPEDKWPLAEGMQWSEDAIVVVVGVSNTPVAFSVKVEGIEQVTVPAGTFECYYIVWYVDDRAEIEQWFSTDVKGVVKEVNRLFWRVADEGVPDTWELKSYSVAP